VGKLTEHFSEEEFACKCLRKGHALADGFCGGRVWTSPALVEKLEQLRAVFGASVTVNSGCRCAKYNRSVGGASDSQHVKGTAADITIKGIPHSKVAEAAEKIGFGGIGRYDSFTHVDVRKGKARWDERKGGGAA